MHPEIYCISSSSFQKASGKPLRVYQGDGGGDEDDDALSGVFPTEAWENNATAQTGRIFQLERSISMKCTPDILTSSSHLGPNLRHADLFTRG